MTPDQLAERISSAPRSAYHGHGYRQQAPRYEPLSGEGARLHGGRFNPPDSFPVLYLCSTRQCAAAEFVRATRDHPIGLTAFLPRALHRYDIELTSVLDLTEGDSLRHLDLGSAELIDDDRTVTQLIGELCHQFGFQAVLNASATGVDAVLAVFIDNLRSGKLKATLKAHWETPDAIPTF